MDNKPIGISVVGASMRSSMLLKFVGRHPEQARITGIFDIIPERGRYLLDEHECTAPVYESLDAAISDPTAKAVSVGTPDHAHVEVACKALAASKHVYCEKPLAITLEDCDAIVATADGSGNC